MYKKSPYLRFPLKPTLYADFSKDDLERMMELRVTYSGLGSHALPIVPQKSAFETSLPSREFTKEAHPNLVQYATSNACAISWATATIAAAEKVLADRGTPMNLSIEYLLDCFKEETNEDICDGVLMPDLADFLATRGLMSEMEAARLGANKCSDESAHVFLFTATKVEAPNRGGLMNLVGSGDPTLSLMSLNLLRLRYTDNMTKDSEIPFTGSYGNPAVYGVVTGYGLDAESEMNVESNDVVGWWMVDIAVTPFEHQQIKLPMRANDTNANYAGIAAYAFSVAYAEETPINVENYNTLSEIPLSVKELSFPENAFPNDELVDLSRFPYLESVYFAKGSFPNARALLVDGATRLRKVVIGENAFANADQFILENTSIEELTIGSGCFNGEEVETPGRRLSAQRSSSVGFAAIFSLINNYKLQNLYIPSNSFTKMKEIQISGIGAMQSIIIDGELGDKKAPFQNASSFVVDGLDNLRTLQLGAKVCQACSVFSANSPAIESVIIGDFCFQGKETEQKNTTAALQFSMVGKSELISISIGKGSFPYFNRFEVKRMFLSFYTP